MVIRAGAGLPNNGYLYGRRLFSNIFDNTVYICIGKSLSRDDLKENSELKRQITQYSIKQTMGQMNSEAKDAKGGEEHDEYDF